MLKLKRYKEGVWVDFPNAVGVRLKIRPVTFSQSLEVLAEVKEKRILLDYPIDPMDSSKKGTQIIDDYKDGAFLWKMFDRALEKWEGIEVELDEGDAPLGPMEIKRVLFDNDLLREFVFKTARELSGKEQERLEEERKN